MKKSLQERLNASLDKALDPPRKRPKQELDALLDEYDDGQAIGARKDITSESSKGIPTTIPAGIPAGIPTSVVATDSGQPQGATPSTGKKLHRVAKTVEEAEQPSSEIF